MRRKMPVMVALGLGVLLCAGSPARARLPTVFYFLPVVGAGHVGLRPVLPPRLGLGAPVALGLGAPVALGLGAPVALGAEGESCARAGNAAEAQAGLPANLLVSIGMVESGRYDAFSRRVRPWPWTVNIDGAGRYFASKAEAVAFTRLAQASGAGDIDVGCFQVSLKYHSDAFSSLDEAFDPASNASYAALYLTKLKAQAGSWNNAIADYHSAVPDLGLPYQRRVLAAWHGLGEVPSAIGEVALSVADPVVIMQAPAARLVHVYTMSGAGIGAGTGADAKQGGAGLPRVVTP